MSIKDLAEKIKPFYTTLLLIVIASIFFALGRLSAIEQRHTPIKVSKTIDNKETDAGLEMEDGSLGTTSVAMHAVTAAAVNARTEGGVVVGSKTGKKYYFPWCGGLKRVKPENRVEFESIEAAKAAGYTPAGNCKGLK